MNTKTAYSLAWLLTAAALLAGLYFYPELPSVMVSHWNVSGQPDGSVPLFWGVVSIPLVCAALIGIFTLIPRIDPLRQNIEAFRREYNVLIVVVILALAVIQVALVAYNFGIQFNMADVILPTLGVLFFIIGSILPHTKRNWFVGIRTPWTIHSDIVWQKTHRAGGILFQLLSVLAILELFLPENYAQYTTVIFVAALFVITAGLIAYSYVVFRETEPIGTHLPGSI